VTVTPTIREFLIRLEELVDSREWPALEREVVTVGAGRAEALVRLPHATHHDRDVAVEIDDHRVIVVFGPERIPFTSRDEALQFVEMLGDGRVELHIHRGLIHTTLRSYRDGQTIPFWRSRTPVPSLRPRKEIVRFGFA
jgi:hypothetical protein